MSSGNKVVNQDWALVVGISKYPDLSNLDGPENDAKSFFEWVTSDQGGCVDPTERARLILSSDYATPAEKHMARPILNDIETEFIKLQTIAEANDAAGDGLRVGRRLYIYFAGHGCAPRFEEAALLMANAASKRIYHITGKPCADWFYRSQYFEEVVLIMDCCRERFEKIGTYVPPWIDITSPDVVEKGWRFYGFATKWSRKSREKEYPSGSGVVRGIFSLALMDGLAGAAYDSSTRFRDPVTGKLMARVTAESLKNYLLSSMVRYLSADDLLDKEVARQPEIIYDEVDGKAFTFATVEVPEFPVTIWLRAEAGGKTLQIRDFVNNRPNVVKMVVVTTPQIVMTLARSFYEARVLGTDIETYFEVSSQAGGGNVVSL
jgi:hypothetical protein